LYVIIAHVELLRLMKHLVNTNGKVKQASPSLLMHDIEELKLFEHGTSNDQPNNGNCFNV